jgi:hypothetical protein
MPASRGEPSNAAFFDHLVGAGQNFEAKSGFWYTKMYRPAEQA